ncbi:hypothetical protein SHAQ108633_01605 [Shewanella aquimarina]
MKNENQVEKLSPFSDRAFYVFLPNSEIPEY